MTTINHCFYHVEEPFMSSKLYFCTYTSVTTSVHFKSHLPAELGRENGRNSLILIR